MLSNIKIEHGTEKVTYQISDPKNGSIVAVGSVPNNEWTKIYYQLLDEIDDTPGIEYAPNLFEYVIVLFIHAELERIDDDAS